MVQVPTSPTTSGSTINIAAFDDPDGNNIVGDVAAKDPITGVVIRFGGSTSGFIDLTQLVNPSPVVGGHTFTITEIGDGSINVGGVAEHNVDRDLHRQWL